LTLQHSHEREDLLIEMPALDVKRSAAFYEKVFGWAIRQRGDGSVAFDDTTGQVSGTWVVGRTTAPGLMVLHHAPEITATFRDPAGNVIGLYQQREPERQE
jgi:predicted enzyme related to lactoylglutathione lyase